MAFERSPSGQSNRAIFFQADLTCYVEGNYGDSHGVDVAFWTSVFEVLMPNRKVHLSPRGGKPILESLAAKIIDEGVQNTIVAMDRDYSEFRENRYIVDRRVLYTFGYSWENDVFSSYQLPIVACRLARIGNLPPLQINNLIDDLTALDLVIGKFVIADFLALQRGGSVFDRTKPGRYSIVSASGRPRFARTRCKQDVSKARCDLKGRNSRPSAGLPREQSRFLWGKAFEHYVRLGLTRTVRDVSGRSFAPDHARDVAIACFAHCLVTGQNSPVLDYYRQIIANLP